MTIIVAAVGVGMASDTQCTDVHGDYYHAKKIFRVGDKLIGVAGDNAATLKYLHWAQTGFDPEEIPDLGDESFEAVLLTKEGIVSVDSSCYGTPLDDKVYPAGCGRPYVLDKARKMRKPSERSLKNLVKIACDNNSNCGVERGRGIQFEPLT